MPSNQARVGLKLSKTSSSPKLRASCDGCSLAKVKCDKKQPTCQRCENSGIMCRYSPSMRMGKTSAASRAGGVKAMTGGLRKKPSTGSLTSTSSSNSSTPKSGFINQKSISPNYLCTHEFKDLMSRPSHASNPIEQTNTSFPNDWSRYSRNFYDESVFIHPTDLLLPASPGISTASTKAERPVTAAYSATAAVDLSLMPCDDHQLLFNSLDIGQVPYHQSSPVAQLPLPPLGNANNQEHDCMRTAQSILRTLSFLSMNGTTSKAFSSLPTIDQALTTNTMAVKSLLDILSCHCAHDPYLPFLLSVISSKVLAWYQAIACANTSAFLVSGSIFAGREMAMPIPIPLGAYKLNGEYEEKMRIQLVLNELRKVEVLVDKYKQRFCNGGERAYNEDTGVYSALETFLRKRLKETVEELRGEENYQMTSA
jgi:hypothetical protein